MGNEVETNGEIIGGETIAARIQEGDAIRDVRIRREKRAGREEVSEWIRFDVTRPRLMS